MSLNWKAQRFSAAKEVSIDGILVDEVHSVSMAHKTFRALLAAILTALAANCFLKYLWWTASYSAWSSIPKMTEQSKLASANASFNGWCFLLIEVVAISVFFSLIRSRSTAPSALFSPIARLTASLFIAAATTVIFALALSWLKQGIIR